MLTRTSLNLRLVLAASAVLVAFLGLTGAALEQAFARSSLALIEERLLAQVYGLLAAASMEEGAGMQLSPDLADPRFAMVESGLYGEVVDGKGRTVWHSPNTMGRQLRFPDPAEPGRPAFGHTLAEDGAPMLAMSFAVDWEIAPGRTESYVFRVAVPEASYDERLQRFRRSLWGWLGAATVGLLLAQALVLGWGLAPLRRLAREVAEVEQGRRERLSRDWPEELRPLAANLNLLIDVGRRMIERYRNALGDLAHSLKTPLAVLRNAATEEDGVAGVAGLRASVLEQVSRMDRNVDYQLQRAVASGRATFGPPVDLARLAERLRDTMRKVHPREGLAIELDVAPGAVFRGDENDLTEILGNLLDNACKWAASRVRLGLRAPPDGSAGVVVEVDDDGPGIPDEQAAAILARGTRLDEAVPGHGIGLSVVKDLTEGAYGGALRLGKSALGGLRVEAELPAAG